MAIALLYMVPKRKRILSENAVFLAKWSFLKKMMMMMV